MNALYRLTAPNRVETSPNAAGPWDARMQHGSAPSSLIASVAEHMPTLTPMRVARLTIDLLRPVPIGPLTIEQEITREGRKIQLSTIRLISDETEVVRASILKLRRQPTSLPPEVALAPPDVPFPEMLQDDQQHENPTAFISGLTLRSAVGNFLTPGPAKVWFRVNRPVLDGQPISPLMRAVITSDFCNGSSTDLDWSKWTFINADLTITLAREPVGDWILLDSKTWLGGEGSGIAFAGLADRQGYFGRAVQNLLIEQRR